MNKSAKIIIGVLVVVAAVAIGFAIASLIQSGGDDRTKEISFAILVSSPGDFTVTMEPVNPETGDVEVAVTKGQPAVFTIRTAAVDGYDGKIDFDVSGFADGTYSFSPAATGVDPGTTVTLTIQTSGLTSNSVYVSTLTASPA